MWKAPFGSKTLCNTLQLEDAFCLDFSQLPPGLRGGRQLDPEALRARQARLVRFRSTKSEKTLRQLEDPEVRGLSGVYGRFVRAPLNKAFCKGAVR